MNLDQREDLRRFVLGFLAKRSACAFNCVSVQNTVRRDMPCTEDEVEETLQFLKSLGFVEEVPNKMGSRRYYQISAAGTLAHERGE